MIPAMRCLLDTHAFLWAMAGAPELSASARQAFLDPANELYLSVASAWEMAIKASIGKLHLGRPLSDLVGPELSALAIRLLPVELAHVLAVEHLPFHHRDPFDRVLVAQALAEGLVLLSRDAVFDRYGVRRTW